MPHGFESPRVRKALDESAARQRVRQAAADAGPYLSSDGTIIVIPSPTYRAELVKTFRKAGFQFCDGETPAFRRTTVKPLNGKCYTPAAWLDWAQRHYAVAWGWKRTKIDPGKSLNCD